MAGCGSPLAVASPLVTLKHGSGKTSGIVKPTSVPAKPTSGIVKPKQEVQKKEEEVGNLLGFAEVKQLILNVADKYFLIRIMNI